MNRGKRIRYVLAMTTILSAATFSCRCGLFPDNAPFSERIAGLENTGNTEVVWREQVYFSDSLDLDSLHRSPLRIRYINAWTASFRSPDNIPPACERLFSRAASADVGTLKTLVREVCLAVKNQGAELTAATIAAIPYGIDARKYPVIASRLLVSTLLPGQPAPPLTNGKATITPGVDGLQTVVFFYESTCRSCQTIIRRLSDGYEELQKAGIRVISISSDSDEKVFADCADIFPWKDRLCDFRRFDSPNFSRYGVAGTPALFLVNEKGVVTHQLESVEELWNSIPGSMPRKKPVFARRTSFFL